MSKAQVQFCARTETEITYSIKKNGRGVSEVSARSALAKRFPRIDIALFTIRSLKGHGQFKHGTTHAMIAIAHLPSDEIEKIHCTVQGPALS
jgi:hypothetical protein